VLIGIFCCQLGHCWLGLPCGKSPVFCVVAVLQVFLLCCCVGQERLRVRHLSPVCSQVFLLLFLCSLRVRHTLDVWQLWFGQPVFMVLCAGCRLETEKDLQ
jgi:hypothetical protein